MKFVFVGTGQRIIESLISALAISLMCVGLGYVWVTIIHNTLFAYALLVGGIAFATTLTFFLTFHVIMPLAKDLWWGLRMADRFQTTFNEVMYAKELGAFRFNQDPAWTPDEFKEKLSEAKVRKYYRKPYFGPFFS